MWQESEDGRISTLELKQGGNVTIAPYLRTDLPIHSPERLCVDYHVPEAIRKKFKLRITYHRNHLASNPEHRRQLKELVETNLERRGLLVKNTG